MRTLLSILTTYLILATAHGQCSSYEALAKEMNKPDLAYFRNTEFAFEKDSVTLDVDTSENNLGFGTIIKGTPYYSYVMDTIHPYLVKSIICPKADTLFNVDERLFLNRFSQNKSSLCYISSTKRTSQITVIDCEAGTQNILPLEDKVSLTWKGADETNHYYKCYKYKRRKPPVVYIIKVSANGIEKLEYQNYDDYKLYRYTSNYQVYYKEEPTDCYLDLYNMKVFYKNVEIDNFDYVSRYSPKLQISGEDLKIYWFMDYEKYYNSGKYSHHTDLKEVSKKIKINKKKVDYFQSDSLYTYAIYTLDSSDKFGLETTNGVQKTVNGVPLQKESEEYQIIALFRKNDLKFLYYPQIVLK